MSCNITNNLLSSFFSFVVSAFSSCADITMRPTESLTMLSSR